MGKTREYGSLAALFDLWAKLLLGNIIAGALNLPSARAHRRSLSNARIKPFRCRLIRHTSQFVSKGIWRSLATTLWFDQIFGEMASLNLVYTSRRTGFSQNSPDQSDMASSEFGQLVR